MDTPNTPFWIRWERSPHVMAGLTVATAGIAGLWWLLVSMMELKEFNRGDGSGVRGCGGWLVLSFLFGPLVVIFPFLLLTRDIRLAYARAGVADGFRLLWPVILVVTPGAVWLFLFWHPEVSVGNEISVSRPTLTAAVFVGTAALFIYHAQRSMNELWRTSVGFAEPRVAKGVVLPASRRLADLPSGKYTVPPLPDDGPADELDELHPDPTTSHA